MPTNSDTGPQPRVPGVEIGTAPSAEVPKPPEVRTTRAEIAVNTTLDLNDVVANISDTGRSDQIADQMGVSVETVREMTRDMWTGAIIRMGHPYQALGITISVEDDTVSFKPTTPLGTSILEQIKKDLINSITEEYQSALDKTATLLESQKLQNKDVLTGLSNRAGFEAAWERLIHTQPAPESLTLVFFDLDHFKRINDTHGHEVGDAVLKKIAEIIQLSVRTGELCFRLGGEEFGILLENVPEDQLAALGEKIRKALEFEFVIKEDATHIPISASIGVARTSLQDRGGATAQELLKSLVQQADNAAYAAKINGRNRVELASTLEGEVQQLHSYAAFLAEFKIKQGYDRERLQYDQPDSTEGSQTFMAAFELEFNIRATRNFVEYLDTYTERVPKITNLADDEKQTILTKIEHQRNEAIQTLRSYTQGKAPDTTI
jgi:diguanylate cyclase (GGDEF)-like protein